MSPNFRTCSKQIVHSIIVICMNTPISNDNNQIYVFALFPSWEFWFLNITTIVNQSDQLTKYILYFMSLSFCRQTYTCYSFFMENNNKQTWHGIAMHKNMQFHFTCHSVVPKLMHVMNEKHHRSCAGNKMY